MNRCKTCRWWALHSGYLEYRYCSHPKLTDQDDGHVVVPDDGARDGEGNGGHILTGPEFGCVHHEPQAVPAIPGEDAFAYRPPKS